MSRYYIFVVNERKDLAIWWRPAGCGYTTNVDKAGLYSEEEARKIERIRGTDVAIPEEVVNALTVRTVAREDVIRDYEKPTLQGKKATDGG